MSADVLVVHEGAARLRWDRSGDRWLLAGRWPEAAEQAAINEHLAIGRPVLVILGAHPEPVYALAGRAAAVCPG